MTVKEEARSYVTFKDLEQALIEQISREVLRRDDSSQSTTGNTFKPLKNKPLLTPRGHGIV